MTPTLRAAPTRLRTLAHRAPLLVVALACAAPWAAAQPRQAPPAQPASSASATTPEAASKPAPRSPDAISRLEALRASWREALPSLRPQVPEGYLLLGEEVLDQAQSAEDRRLAIELLVRALALSLANDPASPLASSACLALADAGLSRAEASSLRAVARSIVPAQAPAARPAPENTDSVDFQVATFMGLVRTGDGGWARQQLRKPEVADRLASLDRMMRRMGLDGAGALEREARRWPCTECGNQRTIRSAQDARLCPTCKGLPGRKLAHAELLAHLRMELWLLRGAKDSWAMQAWLDDGEPLASPDPAAIPAQLQVDVTRNYYRNGAWVRNADGTDATIDGEAQATPADTGKAAQPIAPAQGVSGS